MRKERRTRLELVQHDRPRLDPRLQHLERVVRGTSVIAVPRSEPVSAGTRCVLGREGREGTHR